MKIKFTREYDIPEKRIQDLLYYALEGGSNYWYIINVFHYPNGKTRKDFEYPHLELPLEKDGYLLIGDKEDSTTEPKYLNLASIESGLKLMADKYEKHFVDFIEENEDADTGDIFLQLCLFGEVIYG